MYNDTKSIELIKSKFEIIKKYSPKRIILGCTHYPYLLDIFKKFNNNAEYFNPASCLADIVKNEIKNNSSFGNEVRFCVSSKPEEFKLSGKLFFDVHDNVELIDNL